MQQSDSLVDGCCQANSATFASVDASEYDAIEIRLISKADLKQFQSVSQLPSNPNGTI